jgi:RNA polymerase sigma-70 factor (ECF subfamily)
MYRVTTNVALNKRRGKRRELEVSLEEHLPTYTEDGHRDGDRSYVLADWSSTPEQAHLSVETRKILEHAIDGLPDHYRAVLILRDVEDLSNDEIASIVDDSVGSVKSRLHRARMALREQLTRHFGPRR